MRKQWYERKLINLFSACRSYSVNDCFLSQFLFFYQTISRLMEIAPAGTIDPTPFLYDTTCYFAAGLIAVSALANMAIRPLNVSKILKQYG